MKESTIESIKEGCSKPGINYSVKDKINNVFKGRRRDGL